MRRGVRRTVMCSALWVALWCSSASALNSSHDGTGAGSSALGAALIVPSVQWLDNGQQVLAAAEASRLSPGAVWAQQESRTKYENLDTLHAGKVALEAFPSLITAADGGPPRLPAGEKITHLLGAHLAQVALGKGENGVIESVAPMAIQTSGGWSPVDLGLRSSTGGFAAANPLVAVQIPKRVGQGAQLRGIGVSITPVNQYGAPVTGAEGLTNGVSVFFANTQPSSDTVVKPSARGLDLSTILRGQSSPQQLYFRIGVPRGATVAPTGNPSSAARVLMDGATVAVIPTPAAEDAAGTGVPVTTTLVGNILVLSVAHARSSYRYPITVDPELASVSGPSVPQDWHFIQAGGYTEYTNKYAVGMEHFGAFPAGDYAFWATEAPGYTRIYRFEAEASINPVHEEGGRKLAPPQLASWLAYEGTGETAEERITPASSKRIVLCAKSSCEPGAAAEHNALAFEITTLEPGEINEFSANLNLLNAVFYLAQPAEDHSEAAFNTSVPELEYTGASGKLEKAPNVLSPANAGMWFGPHSGALELESSDGGLGVAETYMLIEGQFWGTQNYLETSSCGGIECKPTEHQVYTYSNLQRFQNGLPSGEDKIAPFAKSAIQNSTHEGPNPTIKVDTEPPHGITLTGLPSVVEKEEREGKKIEYTVYQLGEVQGHLQVSAADGEHVTSSGVRSIAIAVDGREVGRAGGSCSPGPCTASHEWALEGAELGAGPHTLAVVATDNAGNVEKVEYELFVGHAKPVGVGPGSVNPESGDFALGATDVSLSGGLGTLSVTRHYDSLNLTEGKGGPLGPQWTIGLGSLAQLEVMPNGSVLLIGAEGPVVFADHGGTFEAPEADKNLTVEFEATKPAYVVKDSKLGTTTEFTLPKGAEKWMPTVSAGPVATDQLTDEYKTVEAEPGKTVVEPTLELAPHPTATCAHQQLEKLEIAAKGCRALEFVYDEGETTAKGEAESEWGDYKNHLKEVLAVAYSPGEGKMVRKAVVQYQYDKLGRLRSEWNPSISPALKTLYGYDAEGHVVALTPPGQETSAFVYGTISSDPNPGRLLKVTRAPSSAALWGGTLPVKKEAPVLSGTPVVGERMAVSNGTWENAEVVYSYQWADCNAEGKSCSLIAGATNANYTPAQADLGHYLVANVTDTNGGAAVTASSAPNRVTGLTTPAYSSEVKKWENSVHYEDPAFMTQAQYGTDYWVSDTNSNEIEEFTAAGTLIRHFAVNKPKGLAVNRSGDLWVVESAKDEVKEYTETGEYLGKHFGAPGSASGDFVNPSGLAISPNNSAIYVADTGNSRIEHFKESGEWVSSTGQEGKGVSQFKGPVGLITWGPLLFVSDSGNNRIEIFNDETESALREVSHFGSSGSGKDVGAEPQFNDPTGMTLGIQTENIVLMVADTGNNRIQAISTEPLLSEANHVVQEWGTKGTGNGEFSEPQAIVLDGQLLHVGDTGNNRIENFSENEADTSAKYASQYGLEGTAIGALVEPTATADDSKGNLWVLDQGTLTVNEFSESGAHLKTWPVRTNDPAGLTVDNHGHIWITSCENKGERLEQYSETGTLITSFGTSGSGPGDLKEPRGVVADGAGHLWVADIGRERIIEFNEEGKMLEEFPDAAFPSPGAIALNGKHDIWTAGNAKVREYSETGTLLEEFGAEGIGAGQIGNAGGIQIDANGDVLVTDLGNDRVDVFYEGGEYETEFGVRGTGAGEFEAPSAIALQSNGTAWVTDRRNAVAEKWPQPTPTQGEAKSPQAGSTIEYNVPLEGASAPNQLGTNPETSKPEPEKWAQHDDPAYATAIFSAAEPQGWPAAAYTRANIYYMDSHANAVNVALPSGAIATREYNEEGQVTRDLSADNRATALKEPNPAQSAELLDTKNAYNAEGELTDTWGPQHTVRLAAGKNETNEQTLARNHIRYFYNENAKAVEEAKHEAYELVTKTLDGAETPSKEEFDTRTTVTSYGGQNNLGWTLRKPTSTTIEPSSLNLTTTTLYEVSTGSIIERQRPAAHGGDAAVPPAYALQFGAKGTGAGQLEKPTYDAIDAHGNVWVVEYADNRLSEFSASGAFIETVGWGVSNGKAELEVCTASCKAGIAGTGKGQLAEPDGIAIAGGDVYVVDSGNDRVEVLNEKGEWVTQWGSLGTGAGQFKIPLAIAVSPTNKIWVGDSINRRAEEFSSTGAFIEAIGWGVSNGKTEYQVCTSSCQAGIKGSGNGEFSATWGMAFAGSNLYVADTSNNRVEEFNEKSEYVAQFGASGKGNGQLEFPTGIAVSPTTGLLYVTDTNNNRMQVFTQSGTYVTQFASAGAGNGQLQFPEGDAINSSGEIDVVDDLNHRVEKWVPTITGNQGAHDSKTIYYTAHEEAEASNCRNHIEWAGLPCEVKPAAQPGAAGLPELPVTSLTYNVWDQVETTTQAFGATTRTTTTTFEPSGRPLTATEVASGGTDEALPKVSNKYNTTNGTLEQQSTSAGEATRTLTTKYNTHGQLASYIDANENTATFEYEAAGDGHLLKMADGKGNQTYTYNTTTSALETLTDSGAGTFKATHDAEGRILSESYPNGMTAYYSYNAGGTATKIEYKKLTNCTEEAEKCVWFKDSIVPSIHGEPLQQTSTLAEEPSYTFDPAGRLTAVQEVPAGEGCKTRLYAYDEDSNRTALTSREPTTEKKCAATGGTTEWDTYDSADRLSLPGVTYEAFGNITSLPAPEAGEHPLVSTFYVDGQVHTQSEQGELFEYKVDPEGRTNETIANGNTLAPTIAHYDGPGSAIAWTSEPEEHWTRDIAGIDGTLVATQPGQGTTGKSAVLELEDLQGNVVATAAVSETETHLLSKYNSTEFGVPSGKATPPKYAWLGAEGITSTFPSGTVTQDGSTYVPQDGRYLQTQPVEVPAAAFEGTPFTSTLASWVIQDGINAAAAMVAKAEEERHARQAAGAPEQGCDGDFGPCEGEDPGDLGTIGCKVWTTIHFGTSEIWAYGYYECHQAQPVFEMKVCIEEETSTVRNAGQVIEESVPTGEFAIYGGAEGCTKWDPFRGKRKGRIVAEVGCENPAKTQEYRSLVWGRVFTAEPNTFLGWGVSAVRWSGPACEPSAHGGGGEP